MAGIEALVSAFAGGDTLENEAYYKQGKRILDAQNSAAMLDKRVKEAADLANQTRWKQNFENILTPEMDHPDLLKYGTLSGFGGDLKSMLEAQGQQGKNDVFEMMVQVVNQAKENGVPPTDLLNMMIGTHGDKLLGPTNVMVEGQAQADLGKTIAETIAASALADERNASRQKTISEMVTDAQGNPVVVPETETVDTFSRDTLWANPDQVPVEVPVDIPFWPWDGEETQMLPFDDPRAQAAWAEKTPEERTEMLQFLGPEFTMWREANIANDPSLKDTGIAIGRFLRERNIQSANPPQQQVVAEAEQNAARAEEARTRLRWNPETDSFEPIPVLQ